MVGRIAFNQLCIKKIRGPQIIAQKQQFDRRQPPGETAIKSEAQFSITDFRDCQFLSVALLRIARLDQASLFASDRRNLLIGKRASLNAASEPAFCLTRLRRLFPIYHRRCLSRRLVTAASRRHFNGAVLSVIMVVSVSPDPEGASAFRPHMATPNSSLSVATMNDLASALSILIISNAQHANRANRVRSNYSNARPAMRPLPFVRARYNGSPQSYA
jgi:hypothetical protein